MDVFTGGCRVTTTEHYACIHIFMHTQTHNHTLPSPPITDDPALSIAGSGPALGLGCMRGHGQWCAHCPRRMPRWVPRSWWLGRYFGRCVGRDVGLKLPALAVVAFAVRRQHSKLRVVIPVHRARDGRAFGQLQSHVACQPVSHTPGGTNTVEWPANETQCETALAKAYRQLRRNRRCCSFRLTSTLMMPERTHTPKEQRTSRKNVGVGSGGSLRNWSTYFSGAIFLRKYYKGITAWPQLQESQTNKGDNNW